ncbi:MAG: sporulation protein YhbH [Syntrophomonadaceae bacterium]|nr:sporulation protein YhbH [Syntrophomonadaceae bacterium]
MTIFRDYDSGGRDRSTEDRRRHRQLVEDSIKKNIGNIIAEESIIGKSKDKVIKVPIKGLKEYQFIYGQNQPGVVPGTGEEKRGDRFKEAAGADGQGIGDGAGSAEGDDVYETEITLEDLVRYLFEDLELPYMERKKFSYIETEKSNKRWGIQRKGIPPRLSKKRTMQEKIKRQKSVQRSYQEMGLEPDLERFPFREEDLRYHRIKEEMRPQSNAVVICMMDNSGSMYLNKKYLARSFFFLLYQFVKYRYVNVELVFINHTTTAKEVNEDEFFHRGESGGTFISSAYEKALEIIRERYDPEIWNIYAFHCSDGDNWKEDVPKAIAKAQELCEQCNLFGYGEISLIVGTYYTSSSMINEFNARVEADNFIAVSIDSKEDIWPAFKQLLTITDKE